MLRAHRSSQRKNIALGALQGCKVGLSGAKKKEPRTKPAKIDKSITAKTEGAVMINAKFQGAMWQRIGAGVLGLGAFLMLPFSSIAGESAKTPPVTFAKNVAPIFQAKCQECHHP